MAVDPNLAQGLQLGLDVDGDVALIRAAGQLDQIAVPRLRAVVENALDEGCRRIELALDLEFIGSAGLATLLSVQRAAAEREASLVLVRPSTFVARAVETAGLDGLLDIRI